MSEHNLLFPCAIKAPISVCSINARLSSQHQAGLSSSEARALARGAFAAMSGVGDESSSESESMCAVAALKL